MTLSLDSIMDTVKQSQVDESAVSLNNAETGSMFASFGLSTNPFKDSVDTSFFFKTGQYEEAFLKMLLCVQNDISLGLVHAPSGLGKTMVSQLLLSNLDDFQYEVVLLLVSPGMSRSALLKEICVELGLVTREERHLSADLLRRLQDHVMALHAQQKKFVLIIDEAHFLSPDGLHLLRTISNIEIPEKKLTTCLMIGEERLWRRLQAPSYQSIRSRLYQRVPLTPLSEEDVKDYVQFRLLVAGAGEEVFEQGFESLVHKASGGICRMINKICSNALMEAYFDQEERVSNALLQKVIDKL